MRNYARFYNLTSGPKYWDSLHSSGDQATVKIDNIEQQVPHRNIPLGEVNVSIRPNAITLSSEKVSNSIEGTITSVAYAGDHMEYDVTTTLGDLFVIDYRVDITFPAKTTVFLQFIERGIALVKQQGASL